MYFLRVYPPWLDNIVLSLASLHFGIQDRKHNTTQIWKYPTGLKTQYGKTMMMSSFTQRPFILVCRTRDTIEHLFPRGPAGGGVSDLFSPGGSNPPTQGVSTGHRSHNSPSLQYTRGWFFTRLVCHN